MTEIEPSSCVSSRSLPRGDAFEFLCALAGAELAAERIERIANWNLLPESGALRGSRGSPKACLSLFRFAFAILSLTSL
jgi:hypothetical protein